MLQTNIFIAASQVRFKKTAAKIKILTTPRNKAPINLALISSKSRVGKHPLIFQRSNKIIILWAKTFISLSHCLRGLVGLRFRKGIFLIRIWRRRRRIWKRICRRIRRHSSIIAERSKVQFQIWRTLMIIIRLILWIIRRIKTTSFKKNQPNLSFKML